MALLNKDTKLGEDKLLDLVNNTGGSPQTYDAVIGHSSNKTAEEVDYLYPNTQTDFVSFLYDILQDLKGKTGCPVIKILPGSYSINNNSFISFDQLQTSGMILIGAEGNAFSENLSTIFQGGGSGTGLWQITAANRLHFENIKFASSLDVTYLLEVTETNKISVENCIFDLNKTNIGNDGSSCLILNNNQIANGFLSIKNSLIRLQSDGTIANSGSMIKFTSPNGGTCYLENNIVEGGFDIANGSFIGTGMGTKDSGATTMKIYCNNNQIHNAGIYLSADNGDTFLKEVHFNNNLLKGNFYYADSNELECSNNIFKFDVEIYNNGSYFHFRNNYCEGAAKFSDNSTAGVVAFNIFAKTPYNLDDGGSSFTQTSFSNNVPLAHSGGIIE